MVYTNLYEEEPPAYMLSVLCRESNREVWKTLSLPIPHPLAFVVSRRAHCLRPQKDPGGNSYGTADVKVCSYKGKNYCYPEYDSVSALCDKQKRLILTRFTSSSKSGERAVIKLSTNSIR